MAAKISARLFGGAALLIGTGEQDVSKPLRPDQVRKGGIRYLTVLQRRHLSPGTLETDPSSPFFDAPKSWRLSAGVDGNPDIHPSRLVMFRGNELPDRALAYHHVGWGDPVLQGVLESVRNMDATAGNIASLVFEAKVDTIGVPNFMSNLGQPAYEALILKRFQLAEIGKGINGTLIHDSEETLGQKTASFASLPDVLDRFMQLASGAADIPMTRLLGQAPAGLNATGESDMRNYYDRVAAMQTLEITPAMQVLDECLIQSALGARPEEVHFTWNSLWQITDKERADIGKVQVDTVKVLRDTQLVPDDALAEAAVNMLTESGAMPGLEGAVNAYFEEHPDGEDGDEPGSTMPKAAPTDDPNVDPSLKDAEPRTLYVCRKVTNAADILAWAEEQGFTQTLAADDLHVTIAYSRTPVDWFKVGESWTDEVEIAAGGPRMMERFGEATVLLIASSHLSWRHEEIKRAGASWDHPEYQPHITIAYGDTPDLAAIKPFTGKIVLGPEVFAEVDDGWKAKVAE